MAILDQLVSNRKLAAILSADIVGYSAMMRADEEGTVRKLRAVQETVLPVIERFGGRIIDLAGDGILAEFPSAVRAVESAAAVQTSMQELNSQSQPAMLFRIGVNVGDVIHEGDRLYGDGINVAARLQAIADPGGICISQKVHEEVRDRIKIGFRDVGDRDLKNISRPVRVFAFDPKLTHSAGSPFDVTTAAPLQLPSRPSIAVLPFANISGDPEQEYFVDGIVEDMTTALSHFGWLFVIARSSSFTFKGRVADVKEIGRVLGVRYLLQGSVRKAANRLRISAQLIDALTGMHLWADRFDGALEDIFDLQDQVTVSVVGEIAPKLEQVEIERAKRKPTENLDAYDYHLRGMANLHQWTKASSDEALRLFYKAIELDPGFASAYGMAAWSFVVRKGNGWMGNRARAIAEADELARRAVELGADDAAALSGGGYALVFVVHDVATGAVHIDRALQLNPNLASALVSSGWTKAFLGEPDKAIKQISSAMRLSPLDPLRYRAHGGIAFAHFIVGRYEDAALWAEKALMERPNYLPAIRDSAAANALMGRHVEAQTAVARLRTIDPSMRISAVKEWVPLRRPDDLARLEQGLRKAGLSE